MSERSSQKLLWISLARMRYYCHESLLTWKDIQQLANSIISLYIPEEMTKKEEEEEYQIRNFIHPS